jgi:hypothetical protein
MTAHALPHTYATGDSLWQRITHWVSGANRMARTTASIATLQPQPARPPMVFDDAVSHPVSATSRELLIPGVVPVQSQHPVGPRRSRGSAS